MAAPRCPNCGERTTGRFCAACGLPVGPVEDTPEQSTATAGTVHQGSTGRRLAVVGALCLAAATLGFGVTRSSESPEAAETAPTTIAQTVPSVTVAPPEDSTTTTTALERPFVAVSPKPTTSPPGWGPAAGWYVLTSSSGDLLRIDLATGQTVTIAADLEPVLHTSGRLLLRRPSDAATLYVADSAPFGAAVFTGAEITPLAPVAANASILVGHDPELIWVVSPARDGPLSITQLDTATGQTVRTVPHHPLHEHIFWDGGRRTPEFLSPFSGGVYRLQADGSYAFERAGFVDADGRGLVLISDCGATLDCARTWYDAADLSERTDLFAPVPSEWTPFVLGEGSIVGGPGVLIHVPTGRTRSLTILETSRLFEPGTIDISPDGRYLFSAHPSGSYARDLETDTTWRLRGVDLDATGPVFLPRSGE